MATAIFDFVDGTSEQVTVGGVRYRELLEDGHTPVGSVPPSDGISDQLQGYLSTTFAPKASVDWITPEQHGAVGDGATDDTAAWQAALATGSNIRAAKGATYLVNDTLILGTLSTGQRTEYQFNNATLLAGPGMAGKPVVSISNATFFRLSELFIDGNGNAKQGIYAYHMNEASSLIENVNVENCVEDGGYLVGCQASILRNLRVASNGRHGIYLESCNALVLDTSTIEYNTGDGIQVLKGATGYSASVTIQGCTIQQNTGNGVNIVTADSPVKVKNCWIEANTLNGVLCAGKAVVTDNYILLYGTGSNYAINLTSAARGVFKNNHMGSSGGAQGNKLRLDNAGLAEPLIKTGLDIEPNFYSSNGQRIDPSLSTSRTMVVVRDDDFYYQAAKKIDVTNTTAYTKILTAPTSSSIEVTIYAWDTSSGAYGQTIIKTWSSMSNDTRNSFAEVGGATNPFANGSHYTPVYLTGKGAYVRWNGNDLEFKPEHSTSNLWVVEVKTVGLNVFTRPTWLI